MSRKKTAKGTKISKRAKTSTGTKTSKHRTSHGRTAVKAKRQTKKSSGVSRTSKPVNQRSTGSTSARNQEKLLAEATRELMSLGSDAFSSLE
jgi:hypothetical protein